MKQLTNEERFFDYLAFDFAYKTAGPEAELELPLTEDGELFLGFQALDQTTTTDSPMPEVDEIAESSPVLYASVPEIEDFDQSRWHVSSPTPLAPAKQLFGFDAEIDEEYMRRAAEGDNVYRGFESFFSDPGLAASSSRSPEESPAVSPRDDEDLTTFGWDMELERPREACSRAWQAYPEALGVQVYCQSVPWNEPLVNYQPVSYTSIEVLEDYPSYADPESTLLLTYGCMPC